jgi:F-type H+-transporting ATPase subunit a
MPEFLKGSSSVEVKGPGVVCSWDIFGVTINLTETVVLSWIIIAAILLLCAWLTHGLKEKPTTKKQVVAETIVTTLKNLLHENMGVRFSFFLPYVGALFCFSAFGSLIGVLGLRSVTADYSVPLTWAFIAFFGIQIAMFKASGFGGYLKNYLNPLNLISELAKPVSMSFRHFGNIGGGMIISTLIYLALSGASNALHLPIALLNIGVPAVLSAYFDWFSSLMQAFIFCMLTMIYISTAAGDEGN